MNAQRAIRVSLGAGVLVFALKWLAWRITGSVALYSDALESIVNIAGAFVAVIAIRVAAEPPDLNHPWGHAKAEYLSAVTEGVLVTAAALAILHEAWNRVRHPAPLEAFGPGALVAIAASALNAGLALYLRRVGRSTRSPAVLADSAHILSDVWSSAGVLAGITITKVTGLWILDPIIAAIVTINIAWAGWKILRESIAGLMDEAAPEATLHAITAAVQQCLSPAERYSDLRARRAAAYTFVELKLFVADDMTVVESHELCNRIEKAIEDVTPGANVLVHVEPMSLVRSSDLPGHGDHLM